MYDSSDIAELELAELAARLRSGALRATEVLAAAEDRYRVCGESLNAYKTRSPRLAADQAAAAEAAFAAGVDVGPMSGVPVSIKDHFGVAELPVFAGTARELPTRFRAEGPVVAALRRQLAVFVGKTHAVELAFGGVGSNPHWGTPRNPWDENRERVAGGSSSGAGVSLQSATAWLALGTDTGGSVRVPASMTGTVGLKTSTGRWSLDGIVPLSSTLDTAGVLARSVADAAYGFAAIDPAWGDARALLAGFDLRAPDLRLGIADASMWQGCQDDIAEVVLAALDELGKAGARRQDVALPEAEEAVQLLRSGSVVSAEIDAFLERELPQWRPLIDPTVTMRIADGGAIPAREYVLRRRRIDALGAAAERRFRDAAVDVLVAPTVPITPPTVAEVADLDIYRARNAAILSNTCVGNFLSLCGLSVPVGLDRQGMPVGMMLLARRGHEERLLAVGSAIERALGNSRQRLGRPPLY